MTFSFGIDWYKTPELLQYEKIEPLWQFMNPVEGGRKEEHEAIMAFQSSRNMITKHYGSIFITKYCDAEYPYYSLSSWSPYEYRGDLPSEKEKFEKTFEERNHFMYYPDHFTMKGKYWTGYRGGQTFYTRFSNKIFYAIPWREYVPDGFRKEDCEQPLNFSARMFDYLGKEIIDGHRWFDIADDVPYNFDYDGKPTSVEQFVQPTKYKVNRKELNRLRRTALKDLYDYIDSAYPLLNKQISQEDFDRYKAEADNRETEDSHYKTMLRYLTAHTRNNFSWRDSTVDLPSKEKLKMYIDQKFKSKQVSILEPVI